MMKTLFSLVEFTHSLRTVPPAYTYRYSHTRSKTIGTTSTMMRAVVPKDGSAQIVNDITKPIPKPGEVLVRIKAGIVQNQVNTHIVQTPTQY